MKIPPVCWMMITIGMLIKNADCTDRLNTSVKRSASAEAFDVQYFTNFDDIKLYHTNDAFSKLLMLPRSTGEIVVCCRHFTYFVHGRVHTVTLIVYDGLIRDEETGKQLVVKTYPDQTTTKKALERAMIHYMTSLGQMDVKPCVLNYSNPLISSVDTCARGRSISCDQQCIFKCWEGSPSTNEHIRCCDKGQLSSPLPTCRATGGISTNSLTDNASSTPTVTRPQVATAEQDDSTTSKASSLANPTDTAINISTDGVSTSAPAYSPGRNGNYFIFLFAVVALVIIPIVYYARKKRRNIMYSHLDYNSRPSSSEEMDVEPDGRGSYKHLILQPAKPSPTQLDFIENYRMNVREKGLIYILNNKTFILPDFTKLERKGSEIDVENIKHVFEEIGYKPVIYKNLTAQGIRESLENLKGMIESSHPSVVLMFMSHGDEKGILGVDLCHITIREIKDALSGQKCAVLIGKPKMIFVQACRGDSTIKNVLESDWTPVQKTCADVDKSRSILEKDGPEPRDIELTTRNIIEPDSPEADIAHYYIAQSTTEGHFSLRSRVEGSCFIQALCEELIKRAHEETLDTIMALVTRRVQGREWQFNGLKTLQVPQIIKQGIDKDIYLLPKYPN